MPQTKVMRRSNLFVVFSFAAITDTDISCDEVNTKWICTSMSWIRAIRGRECQLRVCIRWRQVWEITLVETVVSKVLLGDKTVLSENLPMLQEMS